MSTTATGLPPNVEIYLEALRAELADLAPDEREDLLSEVEPSLLEAAAGGDDPIAARLGPAADFAADLRASAGLPAAPRAPVARPGLRAALEELAASPQARRIRELAGELAPLWWAARACLAVGALAVVSPGVGWSSQWGFIPLFWSEAGTVLLGLTALIGSCALGLATRRGLLRRTSLALSAATLVAMPFAVDAASAPGEAFPIDTFASSEPLAKDGLVYDGIAVDNMYAYDRAGRLVPDVRLYDDSGRPLEFGRDFDNTDRRIVIEAGGRTVFNSYPVRYFEPGTRRVAEPGAGAPPAPPALRTPPLSGERGGRERRGER